MNIKLHLNELRIRCIRLFFIFIICYCFCYYISQDIYSILLLPLQEISQNKKIIYTSLGEVFISHLKLAWCTSIIITVPITMFEIYKFVRPGLYKKEQKILITTMCFSQILFWLGIMFAFYYVIPKAWIFFTSFEATNASMPIIFMPRISEYLSITINLILAFGFAFQLPIVLLIMMMLNITTVTFLKQNRRLAIVINFILAGILTPPDVISQLVLAIPMILLYELSIVMYQLTKRENRQC